MNTAVQNRQTLAQLALVVVVMGAAAWASVPLYDWFCRVTGFGGTPLRSEEVNTTVVDETIRVRFDASLERNMPWKFRPVQNDLVLRIGETTIVHYEAHNPTSRIVAGSASFNVFPFTAGEYFVKIDCFCFQEQVLQPGQTVEMPVVFYIDPEILNDPDANKIEEIALSYTFYEIDLPTDSTQLNEARNGWLNSNMYNSDV